MALSIVQNIFKNCYAPISENYETGEAKKFFEDNYSHIYYIFFDNFVIVEADLKQRGIYHIVKLFNYFPVVNCLTKFQFLFDDTIIICIVYLKFIVYWHTNVYIIFHLELNENYLILLLYLLTFFAH